ncbi:hybrid sensor histidine kinase/response regulator [Piscinibacter koreensis]|uniref:histidine kinase n=1 Tax=Piscinibacter koreensis TaxID=2742824 RepID=A0A7Y6NKT9_9BURK|nr:hybrid sensor histidine kinase/response regulator [Schlegelella koreensis]NUZ05041.1 hybrid sensor histidine kinase/response regulator [Schlegelella koreensis]
MTAGVLVGMHVDRLLAPASRVFQSTHLFPLLKLHGRADEVHLLLRSASGNDLPVLLSAAREIGGAEPLNHCAVMTMLHRKEFEAALVEARRAAEAATVAKDEFLALVSHELRTPLSAITGWTRLARTEADPVLRERALDTVARNAQIQGQLIEDLLDVSRIVSGKMRVSPRPVELAPIVEAALDTARPSALAKGIALAHALDDRAGIVHADPARVQQIVWNLISNAVKFTPKGGRVEVRLSRAGSRVHIEVADDGAGIDPAHLPYLFDRFWQADATIAQRERTGLGLGLSIVKSLVELHGGTLRAESAGRGAGSRFSVEFPIAVSAVAAPPARAPTPPVAAPAALPLAATGVVLVDDDADTRGFMQRLLEGAGARVRAAATADEALAMIRTEPPQVVLSDIHMAGKDGYVFIRELRADRSLAHQPLAAIALTGLARPHERVEILRAGFQAHLVKPVEPAELIAMVGALAARG